MHNMSFFLTKKQFLDGSKDVTRRLGWEDLEPGEHFMGVEKGQGIKKGGLVRLGECEAVSVRRERLCDITQEECAREGFPNMTPPEFVHMFMKHMRCDRKKKVTRIEFKRIAA